MTPARDETYFTKSQVAQFGELLGLKPGQHLDQVKSDLNWLAGQYHDWRDKDKEVPSRAERIRSIKALRDAAKNLIKALHNLSFAAEGDLFMALAANPRSDVVGEPPVKGLFETSIYKLEAARLAKACNWHIGTFVSKPGPEHPVTLSLTIQLLAELWERWTGKTVTHSANKKREHTGIPQSPAGQFMLRFFEIIDPQMPQTTISNILKKLVPARNRRKSKVE